MSDKVLVFIDAGFLSKVSKRFGEGEYIKFKITDFVNNICSKGGYDCEKVFYYTAPPYHPNNPSKNEIYRKERYDFFKNLLVKDGIVVREGRCQRLKIDGRSVYRQKEVDSLMIIDMMSVLVDYPDIKKVILVSSDSDFVPVIEKLSRKGVKTILYTYFSRKRDVDFSWSNDLIRSVWRYVKLERGDFDG